MDILRIDVFHGDADGICALHQLRLAEPRRTMLYPASKRNIGLLRAVQASAGDEVTVVDLALEHNREALVALLERGVLVRYIDHHACGSVPAHPCLNALIDTAGDTCAGILVDEMLGGLYRPWAVVAAYGDNLVPRAEELAEAAGITGERREKLRLLGLLLNYNACADLEQDVIVPLAEMYHIVHRYRDPLTLVARQPILERIASVREEDLGQARERANGPLVVLPSAAWSRRSRGPLANELALADQDHAHAVLVDNGDGSHAVSVRASLRHPTGAAEFCARFEGGGGRAAAGGIDRLPTGRLEEFRRWFAEYDATNGK